jgi:hypothetical protein
MKDQNQAIFENAIDFLEKSLDEFKGSPKYSILHFAIAVELLLKARLAIEHWSLVVLKNPNKTNYIKGDFISVNLDEAVKKLREVVGANITVAEHKAFKKISSHRNKVIHFYHGEIDSDKDSEELQDIIKDQCECWYHLKTLFTQKWRKHFEKHISRFESLDWKMKRHSEYLSTVYDKKKSALEKEEKSGKKIGQCSYCNFEAVPYEEFSEEFSTGRCFVCGWANALLRLKCECGHLLTFHNDGWTNCPSCKKKHEPKDVYILIDELGYDNSDLEEPNTPANCKDCDGYHTVAALHDHYFCTSCFELFENVGECDFCNENCTGDMSDSYWNGCAICDGKLVWDKDD